MKKIGILGSGTVAKTLASGYIKHGYEVMLGTRDEAKLKDWADKHPNGKVGSFRDAAAFADVLVLAVKGTVARNALELAGAENLAGKTVIDATNPIADAPPQNGVLKFFTDLNSSLMEELQAAFPSAHFVKAYNSVGSAFMIDPDFGGFRPTMFICGNNEDAKKQVSQLLHYTGWEAEDMGTVEAARAIEPLCILWCIPGFLRNQWSHAFKLLKK
jgi:predicted dinucleotide-binding enzyme